MARQLWDRAGVKPDDVPVAQFYENFTGPVLMAIAEMGFCGPDEINDFVADGNQVMSMWAWLAFMRHDVEKQRSLGVHLPKPNLRSDYEALATLNPPDKY